MSVAPPGRLNIFLQTGLLLVHVVKLVPKQVDCQGIYHDGHQAFCKLVSKQIIFSSAEASIN